MTEQFEPPRLPNLWSRREILLRGSACLGSLGLFGALTYALYEPPGYEQNPPSGPRQVRDYRVAQRSEFPKLVVARASSDARELVRAAVARLGGIQRFVSRGDVVAVKPNIGWDRTPAQAANTNPLVVAAVVELCYEAGAHRVIVTDASCNEARRSFQRSGIWQAAHDVGAHVVLPMSHRFKKMRLRGELLDEWPVYVPLLEADKLINVPVAKHHNLSLYTGAMKNWYGVLGGRRHRLHQSIDRSIADLATFMRPTLTVLDATRVLLRNGPQGGNIDDAVVMNQVAAGTDEVALDTYGARLVGISPERVGFLKLGQERGLGSMDLSGILEI